MLKSWQGEFRKGMHLLSLSLCLVALAMISNILALLDYEMSILIGSFSSSFCRVDQSFNPRF